MACIDPPDDEATSDLENGADSSSKADSKESASNAPSGSEVVLYRRRRLAEHDGQQQIIDEPDWENYDTLSLEMAVKWANSKLEVLVPGTGEKNGGEQDGGRQAAKDSAPPEKSESEDPEEVKIFKAKIAEDAAKQKERGERLTSLATTALISLEDRSGNTLGSTGGTTAQAAKYD